MCCLLTFHTEICWTQPCLETHFTVSLTTHSSRKYSYTRSFTSQSLWGEIEAQILLEWSSYFFCLLWRETEREVIKMTISCSQSERARNNICFLFWASGNPTGDFFHFPFYCAAINSTLYYMQCCTEGRK